MSNEQVEQSAATHCSSKPLSRRGFLMLGSASRRHGEADAYRILYLHLTHTAAVDALRVINELFRRPRPKPPEENGGEENGGEENGGEENGGAVPVPTK